MCSCSQAPGSRVMYGLYGIVQHTGRLHNGHYTAYVRSRPMVNTRPPPTAYLAQPPLDSSRLDTDPPPRLAIGATMAGNSCSTEVHCFYSVLACFCTDSKSWRQIS